MKKLNKQSSGFGLIEIIIATVVAVVLSIIGITSYKHFTVKANQTSAAQYLLGVMSDFEKFYSQHGSYTSQKGELPPSVTDQLTQKNNENLYYSYNVYGKTSLPNMQRICLVAVPKANTIMANSGNILVDTLGNVFKGEEINGADCIEDGEEGPIVAEPTVSPIPTPTMTPEAQPESSDKPNKYNKCFKSNGQPTDFSDPSKYSNCNFGASGDVSGECEGGTWLRCSGDCNDTTLCQPLQTGCSGDCNRVFIYDAPCSGNCDNSTLFLENFNIEGICNGYCNKLTIYIKQEIFNTNPKICNQNENKCIPY